ncbi:hypothetical protein O3P69_019697 [Scylla paramamosain]|uniref:Uncharacterized protein n=1 Tax=Scylla paramamosain TaxID=85552 RepID=A0AAW0SXT3_SCYPA
MILSKDLQEILEGVHYFLAEALTRESLSGRAECLRRGLVLQLEALTGAYPTLRICPAPQGTPRGGGVAKGGSSSASLPVPPHGSAPRQVFRPPYHYHHHQHHLQQQQQWREQQQQQ